MKIHLAFFQSLKKHAIPAFSFWEYYVKNAIAEVGFEWDECPTVDWAEGIAEQTPSDFERWKTQTWTDTIAYLQKNPTDLFLSYFYPRQIDVSAIEQIKQMGIPCINFFCDNVREFTSVPAAFKVFDYNWVPEHKAIKLYHDAGIPYLNLPMPMWVDPIHRNISKIETADLSFIGSKDIQRLLLFEDLTTNYPEVNLKIYGAGWKSGLAMIDEAVGKSSIFTKFKNQVDFLKDHGIAGYVRKTKQLKLSKDPSENLKGYIQDQPNFGDYIKITKESAVMLGVNRYPSYDFPLLDPDTYSRLRDIEAPMLGACYLTEYTEGIENLYDIDQEIWTYNSLEDLIEKNNRLQKEITTRAKLRHNGQHAALERNAMVNSLKTIEKTLGLSNPKLN